MVVFLTRLLLAIRSRFRRRARLEAENLILRRQLPVLGRNYLRAWDGKTSITYCWCGCIDCIRRCSTRLSSTAGDPDPLAPTWYRRLLARGDGV